MNSYCKNYKTRDSNSTLNLKNSKDIVNSIPVFYTKLFKLVTQINYIAALYFYRIHASNYRPGRGKNAFKLRSTFNFSYFRVEVILSRP